MKSLPASVSATNENSMLTIASSSNKSLLFRFLNEQVEEGFYALVIDYLKENDLEIVKDSQGNIMGMIEGYAFASDKRGNITFYSKPERKDKCFGYSSMLDCS